LEAREIPARDAKPETFERTISRGDFEAHALDGDRPVAAPLLARDLHAEGPAQRFGVGARAAHVGTFEVALEWRPLELAVDRAVILLLDPRACRSVEQIEREIRLAIEHRQEPPFDQRPEVFLFTVLMRAVRKRHILGNAESLETLP